jgi:putative ABC transport system permease protein
MSEIVITDPQTARILASIQVASSPVSDGDTVDFLDDPLEDLFGEGDFFGIDNDNAMNPDSLAGYLGSFSDDEVVTLTGGDWNFIILRLKRGASAGRVIDSLNKKINSMGATAVNWRIAAGNSAVLLLLVQSLFNGGIFLISAAGIIAAVNSLLISVFKRTREIGTHRAIGAGDGYIRFLVLGVNMILAGLAGCLGVFLGGLFIKVINKAEMVISNELIASLLGGQTLNLAFLPTVAAVSFCVALSLGLVASIFPVETAVRINPVVAVTQG